MNSKELKNKYIEFFKKHNHKKIESASLIPENDPTVLFTTAGMHPLVPFLLGQKHPSGKRLVSVQKCLRTGDIDDVGDCTHNTFFEMLGNWSFGDYWKKEAIEMCFDFLINELKIDKKRLYVTVFKGNDKIPKDEESAEIWKNLGIPKERIFYMSKKDNWWGPAGETGPCGPDTEMFIDTEREKCNEDCKPGCNCGKYFEIWNSVFMEYNKTKNGNYEPLKQKNVDTGMGVERTVAILNNRKSVYDIDSFKNLIKKINKLSKNKNTKAERIVADHLKAATFLLAEKIIPSNLDRGYVLRRLIRRAIRYGKILGMKKDFTKEIIEEVIEFYKKDYKELEKNKNFIFKELKQEEEKFSKTLETGLIKFKELSKKGNISGKNAFLLFQSFGFPLEMTIELANEKDLEVDVKGFEKEYQKHREKSKKSADKKFKGGLADSSEETKKLHTATHLLGEALNKILGKKIEQRGSNINPKRLRFDFNFDRGLTEEEIKKVEDLINKKISEELEVKKEEMSLQKAKEIGAHGVFDEKYGKTVFVYSIGDFSKEICGGPHVKNLKELGEFKIIKEKSIGAGTRRIKAVLNNKDNS